MHFMGCPELQTGRNPPTGVAASLWKQAICSPRGDTHDGWGPKLQR